MSVTTKNFKSVLSNETILDQLQKTAIQIEYDPDTTSLERLITSTYASYKIIPYLLSDDEYHSQTKDLLLQCDLEVQSEKGLSTMQQYIATNSKLVVETTNIDTSSPVQNLFELVDKYQLTKICVLANKHKDSLI